MCFDASSRSLRTVGERIEAAGVPVLRELPVMNLVRPRKRVKLPVVLSPSEAKEHLEQVLHPAYRMALTMIYSCGLRLSEGVRLKVVDIDGERMLVRVENGKGGKERYVPLPERTRELLRSYYATFRPKTRLFPAKSGNGKGTKRSLWPLPRRI